MQRRISKMVDRAEAEQLGLLPEDDAKVEKMMTLRDRSFNEGLIIPGVTPHEEQ